MINLLGLDINTTDFIAIIMFFGLWFGYSVFADLHKSESLVTAMHKHRVNWMTSMIKRNDRLIDTRIVESLLQSATFFASTSILVIGGTFALLGAGNQTMPIINSLPFAGHIDMDMWIIKTVCLLCIFIYAFFKFTWVIRQFNYSLILIVSAPKAEDIDENDPVVQKYIKNISSMISNAVKHFNKGMRSYYFGLVAISWYISPALLIMLSMLVVLVLYRREFLSKTLHMLE